MREQSATGLVGVDGQPLTTKRNRRSQLISNVSVNALLYRCERLEAINADVVRENNELHDMLAHLSAAIRGGPK